jgi:hypothetical protein
MIRAFVLALFACALCPSTKPAEQPSASVVAPAAALEIIESPIADNCYSKVEEKRAIDTVVVHYASAIYWFNADFQKLVGESGRAYAESIGLTRENLHQHKYDPMLVKAIFEAYKVSAHYIIDRDGRIIRLVADNNRAWHAGPSKMPNDGREGVNSFSIGIELMSSHPSEDKSVVTHADAYTDAQYTALNKLIAQLCADHRIRFVVGHDEIAPGRKTDPGPLFQWERVRREDYAPLACP